MTMWVRCRACGFSQCTEEKNASIAGSCPKCSSGDIDFKMGKVAPDWYKPEAPEKELTS
jgi:hypothetical protein